MEVERSRVEVSDPRRNNIQRAIGTGRAAAERRALTEPNTSEAEQEGEQERNDETYALEGLERHSCFDLLAPVDLDDRAVG